MMRFLCVLICIVFTLKMSFGQDISQIQKSIDSLNSLKKTYQLKIDNIDVVLDSLTNELLKLKNSQILGENYFCSIKTNIVASPDKYIVVTKLPVNSKVKVIGQTEKHFEIIYNEYTGWVNKSALVSEEEYNRKKEQSVFDSLTNVSKAEQNEKTVLEREKNREKYLYTKYSKEIANRILQNKIWLGMTYDMALESIGQPSTKNRSVGEWGIHEQWVYSHSNLFLYFENGKLTSWQE